MSQDTERVGVEGDKEDRISALPNNVKDLILELLPLKIAARTCVLSRKWRYNWAMLPYLNLDYSFYANLADESPSFFKETVDTILLQHLGGIVKFTLVDSTLDLPSFAHVDRWMLYVTRNGVKQLTLIALGDYDYILPSSVLNCPTLTHLDLSYCTFQPPTYFLGFPNLKILSLFKVTFVPTNEFCVINVPLLASLDVEDCYDTQYLKIVSPQLECLTTDDIHYLLLNSFLNCQNLRKLSFKVSMAYTNLKHEARTTLEKLFLRLAPTLEILSLTSSLLEHLSAGTVSREIPFLWNLDISIDVDELSQTSYALQLINRLPSLRKLHMRIYSIGENAKAVLKYLDTATFLDRPLDMLEYVVIDYYSDYMTDSLVILLVKLFFACTPTIVRMTIRNLSVRGSSEEMDLMKELRVSPRAELFYFSTTS